MKQQEFYREIEEIVEAEPGSLSGNEQIRDLGGWDSMAEISFIAMLDFKFGISVSSDQLRACTTLKDLEGLCDGKIES
jgi:acyl carrier protein